MSDEDQQTRIRFEYQIAKARVIDAQSYVTAIQQHCQHPYAVKIAKADTGNWDRSQDSYWFDCQCPDCEKRWREDQ